MLSLDAGLTRSLDVDICVGIGMDGLHPMFATGCLVHFMVWNNFSLRISKQMCWAFLVEFMVLFFDLILT